MFRRIACAIVFLIVLGAVSARPQLPVQLYVDPPDQLLREALAHPYGQALVAEFAKKAAQGADSACLKDKGLDDAKLRAFGRDLYQRYGVGIANMLVANIDEQAFAAILKARGLPLDARQELERLRNDPVVRQYLDIEKPLRFTRILDFVVEQLDRYVLLNRIRMRSVSPLATGNDELLRLNPTEQTEEALEQFAAKNPTPELQRATELGEILLDAMLSAFKRDEALMWGPSTFYRGVEAELAEICVIKR